MKHGIISFLLALMLATACVLLPEPLAHAQPSQAYDYSQIDRHALSTPDAEETAISRLAAYLTKPAHNDREKARAIYRWITDHIAYDSGRGGAVRQKLTGTSLDIDIKEMKMRGTICSGYAGLFESLATAVGLKTVLIDGYAKGLAYAVGSPLTRDCGHQWNAVNIDGQWRLLDCAWGSGCLDEHKQYVRRLDEHSFLTPPEDFIYDHLPNDPKWQLLDHTVSKEEFLVMPLAKPAFFLNGLKFGSHTQSTIKVEDSIALTLSAPKDVLVIAKLARDGQNARTLAITQREDGIYKVYAALPMAGRYILNVYTKRADDPGEYSSAVDYVIEASKGAGDGAEFPEAFAAFNERNGRLYEPMSGRLKSGGLYPFRIEAPGAEGVAVVTGGEWVYLTKANDIFEGKVTAREGSMKVAAKYPGQDKYSVLLEYQAEKQASRLLAALSFTSD